LNSAPYYNILSCTCCAGDHAEIRFNVLPTYEFLLKWLQSPGHLPNMLQVVIEKWGWEVLQEDPVGL
jgi:hypothetical protein